MKKLGVNNMKNLLKKVFSFERYFEINQDIEKIKDENIILKE